MAIPCEEAGILFPYSAIFYGDRYVVLVLSSIKTIMWGRTH